MAIVMENNYALWGLTLYPETDEVLEQEPNGLEYFKAENYEESNVGIISGFFNPLHSGHIKYMEAAYYERDSLIVIVNNDLQVKLKGSQPFMDEKERLLIVSGIKWVDKVVLACDKDISVCQSLRVLSGLLPKCKLSFLKGGDRVLENIPEVAVCEELGIKMFFNVGGEKTQSSSALLGKLKKDF